MSSNYPPGVTGNEWQIAGPEWEDDIDVACDCGFFGTVDAWGAMSVTYWECPTCHTQHAVPVEHDPDDFDPPEPDDQPPMNWEP